MTAPATSASSTRLFFAEPVSAAEARFHALYARSYARALMDATTAARGAGWLLAPGETPQWHLA